MIHNIPTSYTEGYAEALKTNPELAKRYLAHTAIGDPLADAMIRDTENFDPKVLKNIFESELLRGQKDTSDIQKAPQSVKDFFDDCKNIPDWVDFDSFKPGTKMLLDNTQILFLSVVAGVLIEGFSTNIARSFFLTGRMRTKGIRRLQQNNRQLLEVLLPGGLEQYNDGWVLSIRIRMIHAKIRRLIATSSEWDDEELGLPISSANLGMAIAGFSGRTLYFLDKLGASLKPEERTGYVNVWRYAGYLMGIPESILYKDEEEALEIYRIGRICEPPPGLEQIVMAASLLSSSPFIAGIKSRKERKDLVKYITKLSRAMIGNDLADQLNFDKSRTFGVLWRFKFLTKFVNLVSIFSLVNRRTKNLMTAFELSKYDKGGISFKLPDHLYAEDSNYW